MESQMTTTPQTPTHIILVDFEAGVVGIENAPFAFRHFFSPSCGSTDDPTPIWREVTSTLAGWFGGNYRPWSDHKIHPGGWNPPGFWGGTGTRSIVGPLADLEAWQRQRLQVGAVVKLGGAGVGYHEPPEQEWVVRPCAANDIPLHLYRRHELRWDPRWRRTQPGFGLVEARRLCFGAKDAPKPKAVYFAKGTTSVHPPAEAVARIGGSESSRIIFLDKFARPIAAWVGKCGGCDCWAEQVATPAQADITDWRALRPLGRSATDVLFGVHG